MPRTTTSTLYPTEQEIAKRVLGDGRTLDWVNIAALLEIEGLPKVDPVMGCRYWPAVRAFLDSRHGLCRDRVPANADGEEQWL